MKRSKKPLPVCETESGAGKQIGGQAFTIPKSKYTMPKQNAQCIADLLLYGEENAVTLQHLQKITGLDERKIRRLIHAERLSGVPILANNHSGYYLPADDAEQERCVSSMRHRAAEIKRAADAIERSGSE